MVLNNEAVGRLGVAGRQRHDKIIERGNGKKGGSMQRRMCERAARDLAGIKREHKLLARPGIEHGQTATYRLVGGEHRAGGRQPFGVARTHNHAIHTREHGPIE